MPNDQTRQIELLQRRVEQLERLIGVLWPPRKRGEESASTSSGGSSTTIGSASEPTESGYSGTWATDGLSGVNVWVSVGDAYYESSDQTLYGYKYRLQFNAQGQLIGADSPTRYTIDVPV